MTMLGYIPFITPMALFHEWWYVLIIPLAFGISIIYKAMRLCRLDAFWREVTIMTTQIVLAMIALATGLILVVQFVVPLLPVG